MSKLLPATSARGRRLQTIVLGLLMGALLALTLLFAWLNYAGLYSTILRGFDRKLASISLSSAPFIDGDQHADLLRQKRIVGMIALEQSALLGLERGGPALVRIDTETGEALEIAKLERRNLTGLAQLSDGSLLTIDERVNQLLRMQPDGSDVRVLGSIPAGLRSLCVLSDNEFIFAGDNLQRIALGIDGQLVELERAALPEPTAGVVCLLPNEVLLLGANSGTVLRRNIETQEDRILGNIKQLASIESINDSSPTSATGLAQWSETPEVLLPAHAFAGNAQGKFFAATDRLLPISQDWNSSRAQGMRIGFRSEADSNYQSLVLPMQRVLESAGLTYHYSTQRIDATRFHYVLDATTGEDHSPLGTEEENPADEAKRLELLYQSGQASQSAIQAFDLWGLLKIGSAPIKNSVGEIVGIIGADVNISVIRSKTALLATFVLLSGAIGLLLAALVSRVVTERILQPITSIRDGALQIAGGNYQQCFQVGRPREAAELSDSLNSMRAALAESVSSLESQCLEYRQRRDVQDLAATLERSNPPSSSGDGSQNTVKQQVYRSDSLLQARLCWQGAALLWASKRLPDPLAEAQLLYSVRLVCQQLSALELPAPELLNLLQRLLPSAVGVALLFDAAGQSVQCLRNSLGQELLFFELEDGPQLTFQEVSKRSTQVAEHAWLRAPIPSFTQEGIE